MISNFTIFFINLSINCHIILMFIHILMNKIRFLMILINFIVKINVLSESFFIYHLGQLNYSYLTIKFIYLENVKNLLISLHYDYLDELKLYFQLILNFLSEQHPMDLPIFITYVVESLLIKNSLFDPFYSYLLIIILSVFGLLLFLLLLFY